jgi:hypothetical protein
MRLGRALGAAMLPCVLVLAGCNGSTRADDPRPTATSAPSTAVPETGGGQTAEPALDPAHAVDPPGKRTGRIGPADIVVNSSKTIDEATVERIEALADDIEVEPISLVQVTIENRALSVAAVDPATYRNWVIDARSAQTERIWQRVAQGELAMRPALERRVPTESSDFVRLGSSDSAPAVHLGAIAAQSWLVDAVVNESWIKTLGMTAHNALLVRTVGTAPSTLRQSIERILQGTDASVQMTDAVARNGLDPDVVQTAVVVGTVGDAVGTFRYSVLSGGRIAPDPSWVSSHIATEAVPILGTVTCNKLIFPQLEAALQDVISQGLADKIHPGEFAGCYYPRFIAGSTTLSNHAFGLALDLNTPGNQRGTAGEMDRGVVAIFKRWGFAWGGDWRYTDPMHFEMEQLVRPG